MTHLEKVCEILIEIAGRRECIFITHLFGDKVSIYGAYILPIHQNGHKHYGTGSSIEFAIHDLLIKQGMIEEYDAEGNYSLRHPNAIGQ